MASAGSHTNAGKAARALFAHHVCPQIKGRIAFLGTTARWADKLLPGLGTLYTDAPDSLGGMDEAWLILDEASSSESESSAEGSDDDERPRKPWDAESTTTASSCDEALALARAMTSPRRLRRDKSR
jgi:hypothetical protein